MNPLDTARWLRRQAFSYGFTAIAFGGTLLITEGVELAYRLTGRKRGQPSEQPEQKGIISRLAEVPKRVVQAGTAWYHGQAPDLEGLEKELAQWQAEGGEGTKIIEFNGFQYEFSVNPAGRLRMELYRSKLDF